MNPPGFTMRHEMENRLELRIDGPFEARDTTGAPVNGLSARGRAMLAILALSPDSRAPRETLATLLWGDRAETQARGSLRQELSALRKTLPEGTLVADRDVVRLVAATIAPPPPGAVLLDGVAISSGPFEDWLRDARARRADDLAAAALTEARQALAAGDGPAAQACASRALDHAPDNETAVRLLIKAVTAGGDRSTAHAAFRRFAERQHTEYGIKVPEDLQALVDGMTDATPATARPEGREPAIAVLPFDELSSGAGDMFADGVVEEITGALSRVQAFRVIARQSAFALKGKALDVQDTARRLRADYLVEGSVRRSGDRVRIAVQLVGGETGETLWSERYDDRMDDLFDLQDRIAAHVAGQLAPSLRHAEILRARRFRPEDRSAYDLVLTALPHFWAHQKAENARAVDLLNAALARDPDYGPALAYKAWALAQKPSYMWSDDPDTDHRTAIATARAALDRVGDHAPSLVAIGAAFTLSSAETRLAERLLDRALTLDPNNAWGLMRRGWLYTYIDRAADALDVFDRAEDLSPLDPFRFNIFFGQAVAVRVLGRYDEAVRLIHEGMHANPGCTWVYRVLAGIYKLMGREADSDAALAKLLDHYPHLTARYLLDCIPPAARDFQPDYVDALRRLGLPEG